MHQSQSDSKAKRHGPEGIQSLSDYLSNERGGGVPAIPGRFIYQRNKRLWPDENCSVRNSHSRLTESGKLRKITEREGNTKVLSKYDPPYNGENPELV